MSAAVAVVHPVPSGVGAEPASPTAGQPVALALLQVQLGEAFAIPRIPAPEGVLTAAEMKNALEVREVDLQKPFIVQSKLVAALVDLPE